MEENNHTVFMAKTLSDVFYHIKTVRPLQILGGCTRTKLDFDAKALSVRAIPELKELDKRERYIDFGPAVTLSEMLSIGRTNMPSVLYDALSGIATEQIRNIATLGGNICAQGQKLTLWSPLLALDARIEIKNQTSTKYIPFKNFTKIPEPFVLTKIRVPIDDWEVAIFRRIGPLSRITPMSAGFTFLVNTEKDIVVNIKIAFAGMTVFRSREFENKILGSKLPLEDKFITELIADASNMSEEGFKTSGADPMLKQEFLHLLRYSLEQLT